MIRCKHAFWIVSLASVLGGCGGGGSTQVVSAPPPVGSPAPTPSPSTPGVDDGKGPSGFYPLAVDKALVTYGGGIKQSGEFPETTNAVRSFGAGEITIDYDPAQQAYTIHVPGQVAGQAVENTIDNSPSYLRRYFDLIGGSPATKVGWVRVDKKTATNLTYTTLGSFSWTGDNIDFATGIPTATGDVPVTGKGTYSASVEGWSTQGADLVGNLLLDFDFAQGALSGQMNLMANDGTGGYATIGNYLIADGVHAVGSTSFAGSFTNSLGLTGTAKFDGSFMGPGAVEVAGRWQVPIRIPDDYPSFMRGDFVGAGVFAGARK